MKINFSKTALAIGISAAALGASTAANAAADWAGAYVGATAGASSFEGESSNYYGDVSSTETGATGGLTAGYNWQNGSAVYGVEVDVQTGGMEEDSTDYDSSTYYQEAEWNWYSTVRGRAGLAMDNTLLYVTGGLAIVDTDAQYCYNGSSCLPSEYDADTDGTEVGFAFGAGVEIALKKNVSAKAEYMHVTIDSDETHRVNGDPVGFDSSLDTLRIGVNWLF